METPKPDPDAAPFDPSPLQRGEDSPSVVRVLLRDPFVLLALGVSALASIASIAVDSPAVGPWLSTWVDPALLTLQAVAFLRAAHRATVADEKPFWRLLGLGSAMWALVAIFQVTEPFSTLSEHYFLTDLLILGFFLAVLLAAETHLASSQDAGRAERLLQTCGLVFFVASMAAYFVAVPLAFDREGYETLSPSLLCFTLLDFVVAVRFVVLARAAAADRWRLIYRLLAVGFILYGTYDLKDFLFLRWNIGRESGGPADVLWYLPFIAVIGAASLSRRGAPATRERELRSTSPLSLYLTIVPIAHLLAERLNPLKPAAEEGRELAAIVHVVILGGLAIAQYGFAERRNRKLRQELRSAAEELQRAGRLEALGRLAGVVAHDFNNLLSVILGYADLLQAGAVTEDDRTVATEIRDAAERGASLTRQLLAFSRHQPVVGTTIELDVALEQSLGLVRRLVGEAIEVRFEPGARGAWCRCGASQLSQVVLNLSANARDAMPRGGRLTLRTRRIAPTTDEATQEPIGARLELEVADEGTGIAPSDLPRLFEPFFTTKAAGTGLGLAAVHGIARQHGGDVRVESEVGRGTRVHVFFLEAAASAPAPAARRPAAPTTGIVAGERTVLLAEDETALRALLRRALEHRGWKTIDCPDGETALERAAGLSHLDALVTDLVMPGMSGQELANRLRVRWPGLPVLFMSGYADDVLERQDLQRESTAVLVKPFEIAVLVDRLAKLLAADPRGARSRSLQAVDPPAAIRA